MRKLFVFWFAAFLLLFGGVTELEAQPKPGATTGDRPSVERQGSRQINRDQRRTEQTPATRGGIEEQHDTDRAKARAERAEQRENDNLEVQRTSAAAAVTQARLALAQAVFGVIGIILLLGTLWYTRETAQSATRSATSAEGAIEESRAAMVLAARSATAAENALALAERHFATTHRAYVGLTHFHKTLILQGFVGDEGPIDYISLAPSFLNTGTTPARNVYMNVQSRVVPDINNPGWEDIDPTGKNLSVVAPNAVITGGFSHFTKDQVLAAMSGELSILIRVTVLYQDVFSDDLHETSLYSRLIFPLDWNAIMSNPNDFMGVSAYAPATMT